MKTTAIKRPNHNAAGSHTLLHLALSFAVELLLLAALLCLFAKVLSKADVPLQFIPPIATFSCCGAAFLAALLFAQLHKEKGLLFGLIFGAILFAVLWIIALAQGETVFSSFAALKCASMLLAGALGGFVGTLLMEKRRKIH